MKKLSIINNCKENLKMDLVQKTFCSETGVLGVLMSYKERVVVIQGVDGLFLCISLEDFGADCALNDEVLLLVLSDFWSERAVGFCGSSWRAALR